MVYGKIELILGVRLTQEEAAKELMKMSDEDYQKFLDQEKEEGIGFNEYDDLIDSSEGIQVYFPICCSEKKDILIGTSIGTIWRVKSRCDNCSEYYCCDQCFGQTDHGYYNFNEIFDNYKECPLEHICSRCHYDNQHPLDDCKRCKYPMDNRIYKYMKLNMQKRLKKEYGLKNVEVKVYYRVDDCGSCT